MDTIFSFIFFLSSSPYFFDSIIAEHVNIFIYVFFSFHQIFHMLFFFRIHFLYRNDKSRFILCLSVFFLRFFPFFSSLHQLDRKARSLLRGVICPFEHYHFSIKKTAKSKLKIHWIKNLESGFFFFPFCSSLFFFISFHLSFPSENSNSKCRFLLKISPDFLRDD